MPRQHLPLIRNLRGWHFLETFLVAAVSAIFAIRIFLQLAGYPQLGGRGLHIAHMLWGGLMMLAAIVLLIAFLGRGALRWAAIVGGLGFGTFIDEVGKFVTSDNNYFFQPAVALIYVVFMATFLVIHTIQTGMRRSPEEYLANALREAEEAARHNLTEEACARISLFLSRSDPANPLVPALRHALAEIRVVPDSERRFWRRARGRLRGLYHRLAGDPRFATAVTVFFAARLILELGMGVLLFSLITMRWGAAFDHGVLRVLSRRFEAASFADLAQLFSGLVSGVFTLLGILRIRKNRLFAFEMFEGSLLVSIFLTEVFSFYQEQFAAVLGLAVNVLALTAVRFIVGQERIAAFRRPDFRQDSGRSAAGG